MKKQPLRPAGLFEAVRPIIVQCYIRQEATDTLNKTTNNNSWMRPDRTRRLRAAIREVGSLVRARSSLGANPTARRPLKRFRGPNGPPMAGPGTRRFAANKRKWNKYHKKYPRKYPRSGSRRVTRRPNSGAVVPLSVHRQYTETTGAIPGYPGTVVWPLQNPVVGNTPSAAACYVPLSYQEWQRGLADNEFSGSRVVLKNISVVMQMVAPEEVLLANAKPYRLRITHGWCKTNARVQMSSTLAAARQLPNGMGVNQIRPNIADPLPNGVTTTPIHTTVRLALDDTVGIFGTFQTEGSFPQSQFHIIRDEFVVMTPTTEHDDANGGPAQNMIRAIKPLIRKFNWTANKQLRLCPLTSAASVALSSDANSWFAPVNTPADWIPFINISALNKSSYSTNLDLPLFKFTENTYFLDN